MDSGFCAWTSVQIAVVFVVFRTLHRGPVRKEQLSQTVVHFFFSKQSSVIVKKRKGRIKSQIEDAMNGRLFHLVWRSLKRGVRSSFFEVSIFAFSRSALFQAIDDSKSFEELQTPIFHPVRFVTKLHDCSVLRLTLSSFLITSCNSFTRMQRRTNYKDQAPQEGSSCVN